MNINRIPLIVWIAILLILPIGSTVAEDHKTSAKSPADFQGMSIEDLAQQPVFVYSATHTDTELKRIPNRVIVVTKEDIKRRNYKFLPDILNDLPGVNAYRRVQTEFGVEAIVRGIFQNNKLLVLWNGQRINAPSNKPYHFGNQISLDNVQKIEFIYGPASALYGADVVNGIINIITDSYDDLDGKSEVSGFYGDDQTYGGYAQTGFATGEVKGTLFAAYRSSDGPDFLDDYPDFYAPLNSAEFIAQGGRPGFEANEESFEFQGKFQLGEDTHFHFLHTDDSQSSAWGFTPPVFEFSDDNIWREEQTNFALSNTSSVGESSELRSRIEYSRREVHPSSQFINAFFNNFESVTREDFKFERGSRFALTEEIAYEMDDFTFVFGGSYEHITSLAKLSTVTGQPANPDLPLDGQANENIPIGEVSYKKYGIYGQVQYDVTEEFNVLAGLRWDEVWDYGSFVNPRIGATYRPNEDLTFRASYATATLTPANFFRFENFNNVDFPGPNTIGALPNPNLEEEDYQTVEVGMIVDLTDSVTFGVDAYYNEIDNYLLHQRLAKLPFTFDPGIGNVPPSVVTDATAIFTNVNGGDLESYGFDLSLRVEHGESIDGWLYYSYLDGEQTETSDITVNSPGEFDLALIPNHTIKGGTTISFLERKLDVTPYFVWYDDIKTRPDNPTFAGGDMDGFFLLNLSLGYEFDNFRIWGLAKNVLDESYSTPAGTGGEIDAPEQPQDRFSWLVGGSIFF